MRKTAVRGSLERRFVVSILWVGVIPMVLAMIIGYLAAREAQQMATLQNLATAARKTADGIRLALEEREYTAMRMGRAEPLVAYLEAYRDDPAAAPDEALLFLSQVKRRSAERTLNYALYDPQGRRVAATNPDDPLLPTEISEPENITKARFTDLRYSLETGRYIAVLAAPVTGPEAEGETLGYLLETQSLRNLLLFLLGDRTNTDRRDEQQDRYEIVIFSDRAQLVVYPDTESDEEQPPPLMTTVDPKLAERLSRNPERDSDRFFFWNYTSRNAKMPVLLAYNRLMPDSDVFVTVHRPTPQVFSRINLAALVTLLVSGLIIGAFCIVAYRIVNNTVIRPVSLLNEGAQIIRQGDLDLKLRVETGDEIEELAASFNQMAAALRHNMGRVRESEEKYRSLVTSMRDGLFQTRGDGAFTFINPAGVSILGFRDYGETLGLFLGDLFDSTADWDRIVNEGAGGAEIKSSRIWMRQPGGARICVELSGTRIFDAAGRLTGIEGVFRDVTRSVHLEEEVRERAERMAVVNQIANAINSSLEAGRLYESLTTELRKLIAFDYAAISLRLEDDPEHFETRRLWPEPREGREQFPRLDGGESCAAWVIANDEHLLVDDVRSAHSVFGYQYPDTVHSILCVPLHATGAVIGTLNLGSETPGRFTDHDVDVLVQLAPHFAAALRNAQLLESLKKSLEDITRAQEKLHEANEELKSLDEMKTNLLSNVSHELRTPLVAVMGYTDMVVNGKAGPVNDVQREYLGICIRNVEKLVTLIENLLDFSRLHRGTEEVLFTRFDLLDCIRISMESVQPMADAKNVTLACGAFNESGDPLEPPVMVEGDKGKLGQVFNNLLSNAVKFNHPGGTVTVTVETRHGNAYIAVTDTGIGIPADALDKVFTRFYQVDSSSTRKYGGTGIGLAIAQDIVRLHGSRITVTSREGEGACFRFSLSVVGRERQDDSAPGERLSIEEHHLVELVTQDRALANQIRNLLADEGMDIIHAAYPAGAAALADRHNPDCILLDTEAGALGSMVVDEVLDDPAAARRPVILMTNDDALHARYERRVAGRIRRSFRRSTLLSGINNALSAGAAAGAPLGDRILCVDDDPEVGQFIIRCLEAESYPVDYVDSGEAALEKLADGAYWLVLLDIFMPGMDGWETCRWIKSNPKLAGIKVYMVTAKPVDSQLSDLRDAEADGCLQKPFRGDDLLSVIRAFDAQRRK
ncbi:MAG: response regulator [Candidatus Hydrogenedentes bacterium]|nr:response regulator [Candidatus Hydrogenedentota bacterium]